MRKLFLIASFSAISAPARRGAPAPRLTHHSSLITHHRLASFLFNTNKPHRIIIVPRALLKTKDKQFSIQYKFASREIGVFAAGRSARPKIARATLRGSRTTRRGARVTIHKSRITPHHTNAPCLAVPVVLTCPAASGPNWFAGSDRGLDGDETVEFDGTAGRISSLCGAGGKRRGIQPARGGIGVAVWRAVRRSFGLCRACARA